MLNAQDFTKLNYNVKWKTLKKLPEWFMQNTAVNILMNGTLLREKAIEIAKGLMFILFQPLNALINLGKALD
jgi:hypothetical protein